MPKIYTYKGVSLWFWSNEHERLDYRVGNKGYLKVLLHGLMVYKR